MGKKFETQFEKVVGGSDEEKARAKEILGELLEDAEDLSPKAKRYELPKTKEDIGLIEDTEKNVYALAREYGGSPKTIPLDKIHLVSSAREASGKHFGGGWHDPMRQYIVVERRGSELNFIGTLAHEFFHKASYKSAQIYDTRQLRNLFRKKREKKEVDLKRSGINIIERGSAKNPGEEVRYFKYLEEAIVGKLTDMFIEKNLRENPKYKKSFEDMDKIKNWLEQIPQMFPGEEEMNGRALRILPYLHAIDGEEKAVGVLGGDKDNGYKLGYLYAALQLAEEERRLLMSSRIKEQEAMSQLFDDLIKAGVYVSRKEAFDAFSRANFGGKLLPLARQIKSVLGQGSFRKIAERFKTEPRKSSYKNLISWLKMR